MKLGCSINLFDGEEFLYASLSNLRNCVDYIIVVNQQVSYQGNHQDKQTDLILKDLYSKGFYDKLIQYECDLNINPHQNELNKRNLAKNVLHDLKCTHFINLDADEFYDKNSFLKCWNKIKLKGYCSTASQIQDYYGNPTYQYLNLANYNVPFIYKIDKRFNYKIPNNFSVYVDPTRKYRSDKFYMFNNNDLIMHHFTYVRATRDNLIKKFINSSAYTGLNIIPEVNKILSFDNYDNSFLNVNDYFNIKESFDYYESFY